MADDSGQRLLDVIDDPNALDEFLGTLTSDSVNDNVVESLARSLAAEFDVDSPNENLFDSSSANLTDISQSAVPFDFGTNTGNSNDTSHQHGFSNNSMSSDLNSMSTSSAVTMDHFQCTTTMENVSQQAQYVSSTNNTANINFCDSSVSRHQHHLLSRITSSTDCTTTQFSSNTEQTRSYNSQSISGNSTNETQQLQFSSLDISSLSSSSESKTTGTNIHNQSTISANSNSISIHGTPIVSSSFPSAQHQSSESTMSVAQAQSNGGITTAVYATTGSDQTAQYASIGQLVQAQQHTVLTGMNQQLLTTNTSGISLNTQSGTSFIIDPSSGQPMMVTTGGNTFGTNLLMAGVQPTYTVLPTQASLFSNAITVQPQIQAIKTTHGTTSFIQTTTGASLVSHAQVSATPTAPMNVKAKQPPQLLPKPSGSGNIGGGATVSTTSTQLDTPESPSTGYGNGTGTSGSSNVVVTSSTGSISMTSESLSQIIQHQANATNAAAGGMSISQPSFAIGAGGQVVQVSGMQTLNTISGSQTLFMNQFGQQVLVPAAMSQGGMQFILRQQPQAQVLTIQAPSNATSIGTQQATTTNGKIVRFVSQAQMPQVTQGSIQLQQIQTPQGPTWVAVRSQAISQPVVSISQPTAVPMVVTTTAPVSLSTTHYKAPTPPTPTPPTPPPATPSQPLPVVQVTTDTISAAIQSVIDQLKSPSPSPPITQTVQSQQYSSPISSIDTDGCSGADYTPPPKKKPKYTKKKKVTLDLEQLLKQSGIMDEDLQDDGMGFGDFFASPPPPEPEIPPSHIEELVMPVVQNGAHNNNNNNSITPNNNIFKPNGVPSFSPALPAHSHILKPIVKSIKRKCQTKISLTQPSSPTSQPPLSPLKMTKGKSKKKIESVINSEFISNSSSPPITPVKFSKGKKLKKSMDDVDCNVMTNSNFIPIPKKPIKGKGKKKNYNSGDEEGTVPPEPSLTVTQTPSPTLPMTTNTSTRRIVQTIQLTPQNQTLLRNIQAQIQKLLSLTSRNEVEENALQKLISLQAEVIKTGKPVPNPPHLQTLNSTTPSTTLTASQLILGSSCIGTSVLKASLSSSSIIPVSMSPESSIVIGQQNGLTNSNSTTKSPSVSPNVVGSCTNQPPPLVLNKSCTNAKILITTTTTMDSSETTTEMQKIILLSSQGSTTIEEFNGTGDEVTSSSMNITPTTTISTSMCNNTNGNLYYSTFDPSMTMIDEKKLEEQLIARLKQEEEAQIQWRKEEFEKRLSTDHQFFINPDYETKFKSKFDATERLMHFNVGRDTAEITFEEFDKDFAETSSHLLVKFSGMVSKYRALLLKESMKEVECAERVMLERMFVAEEKLKLEHDRQLVQQGEVLELPPPPSTWLPKIRQLVDAEVREMERDSLVNQQVQSAIDSIMSFGNNDSGSIPILDDRERIEYDAFGVPISSSNYNNGMNSSSADIDEAVRSILL